MPNLPPSSAASVRSWPWLLGAFGLAMAVQAIFILMPEPKSAGASDPAAPAGVAAMDSTAFTLAEDETVLPEPLPDSLRRRGAGGRVDSAATLRVADSVQSRPAWSDSVERPRRPVLPVVPDSATGQE